VLTGDAELSWEGSDAEMDITVWLTVEAEAASEVTEAEDDDVASDITGSVVVVSKVAVVESEVLSKEDEIMVSGVKVEGASEVVLFSCVFVVVSS